MIDVATAPQEPKPDRLLTTRQVAEFLGLSTETVLRWYHAGELPGYQFGSKVIRFRESEIEAWIERRRE